MAEMRLEIELITCPVLQGDAPPALLPGRKFLLTISGGDATG
jgi:hypothetical protein